MTVIPALGHPMEMWDDDGDGDGDDYFCRPRPDLCCGVLSGDGDKLIVTFTRWNTDPSRTDYTALRSSDLLQTARGVWQLHENIAAFDADCPLQVMAIIEHFISTHPYLENSNGY